MKSLILVIGRTSSGKTELTKQVAKKYGLTVLKSYTTRPPRKEELEMGLENTDHLFISEEEYQALHGIIAETTINGYHYCTTESELERSDFYVIDPNGVEYLQRMTGGKFHLVQFYIYADEAVRQNRSAKRSGSVSEFQMRAKSENQQFQAYEDANKYDIIIYNNGKLEESMQVFESYMKLVLESRLKELAEEKEKDNRAGSVDTEHPARTAENTETTLNGQPWFKSEPSDGSAGQALGKMKTQEMNDALFSLDDSDEEESPDTGMETGRVETTAAKPEQEEEEEAKTEDSGTKTGSNAVPDTTAKPEADDAADVEKAEQKHQEEASKDSSGTDAYFSDEDSEDAVLIF